MNPKRRGFLSGMFSTIGVAMLTPWKALASISRKEPTRRLVFAGIDFGEGWTNVKATNARYINGKFSTVMETLHLFSRQGEEFDKKEIYEIRVTRTTQVDGSYVYETAYKHHWISEL